MRWRALLVGGLALLAGLLFTATAQAVPKKFYGIFAFDLPTLEEAAAMDDAGVGIARVQFSWRGIEPERPFLGVHDYRWENTDAWVGNLARNGISGHGLIIGSPSWLTESNAHSPLVSPQGRRSWRKYVRAVIERYGRGGDFWLENPTIPTKPIKIFQIWNEQNSAARYKPRPDPRDYADLLGLAEKQIHAVDPRARVVLGGMFGTPNDNDQAQGSMPAWRFLRKLYAIKGTKRDFDAVGAHPYSPDMRGLRYQMNKIRKVMDRQGDRRTPIEVTELGWSSGHSNAFFFFAGPKGQARNLKDAFTILYKKRRAWKVRRILWISWRDTENFTGCGYCRKFGLLTDDLEKKPAFRRYVRFTSGELPKTKKKGKRGKRKRR